MKKKFKNKFEDYPCIINSNEKALEILDSLKSLAEEMDKMDISGPYRLKLRLDVWNLLVGFISLPKLLSFFREKNIKGVDVYTSYGIKKVDIWL